MALKDHKGNWINRSGKPVPEKNIPRYIKNRDRTVNKVIGIALRLQARMEKDKARMIAEIEKLASNYAKDLDIRNIAPEGNVVLSDYSSVLKIKIQRNDIVEFDERLNLAKSLIDKCLVKWSKDSDKNLQAIISQAFNVDKRGNVSKTLIFGLLKFEVKDPDWKKAIELIKESIDIKYSKQYLTLQSRNNTKTDFKSINLNFSSL